MTYDYYHNSTTKEKTRQHCATIAETIDKNETFYLDESLIDFFISQSPIHPDALDINRNKKKIRLLLPHRLKFRLQKQFVNLNL